MSSSFFEGTMLEMTWPEIAEAAKKDAVVLFPIAVVEEHGPHMSVSVDIFMSYALACEAQRRLKELGMESIIAPPFYWGINGTTKKIPGSFYVTNDTFTAMLVDVFMSLKRWGFNKIIALPGHGENDHSRCMDKALEALYQKTGAGGYLLLPKDLAEKAGIKASAHTIIFDFAEQQDDAPLDIHAGFIETSFMLHDFPDHVRTDIMKDLKPAHIPAKDYGEWEKGGALFDQLTPQGYVGDPASANPEFGKMVVAAVIDAAISKLAETLQQDI